MGSGGGSSAPAPKLITPGQAAQAAVGTAGAGELMSIANQPIEQYANLYTTDVLGPQMTQSQQALANQAALQSAQGQMAIQSQVDPLAYAQRQMRLTAATNRLGSLYGTPSSQFSYSAPQAFQTSTQFPSLTDLQRNSSNIARNLSLAQVNNQGADPSLIGPTKPQNPDPVSSYFTQ